MLKVKFRNPNNENDFPPITDFPSGTIVEYDDGMTKGYGMIMSNPDGGGIKIWDFEMNEYYSDCENYFVIRELDATITIEN